MLLFDTHADTLHCLAVHKDVTPDVNMDRLRQGGVSAQTLALFVGGSSDLRDIARVFDKMFREEEKLKAAGWKQLTDYRDAVGGENAYILSVEGCDLLKDDLALLGVWRKRGIRMAALTWNYENCVGTPAKLDHTSPLKSFGREAVKEMVRLGIAPDTSHLNERGFYDLLEMGVVPLASHSCCKALCGHRRNLSDDQLRALFQAGGYVGVNFYPYFLNDDGEATIDTICDHVIHMMEMGGEKQIGFGSDFDGIECKPRGMDGPQDFPRLLSALRARGLTEPLIEGLAGRNLMAYYDRVDPR
ncbi:MAG: membrane dipeptidase [Clostridia bacterium]|nr:membrane dipeptidase [Clostridia bacterium]